MVLRVFLIIGTKKISIESICETVLIYLDPAIAVFLFGPDLFSAGKANDLPKSLTSSLLDLPKP